MIHLLILQRIITQHAFSTIEHLTAKSYHKKIQIESMWCALDISSYSAAERILIIRHCRLVPGYSDGEDVCRWRGISCDDESTIKSLQWNDEWSMPINLKALKLGWLPNTIVNLSLESLKGIDYDQFETRLLPKDAVNVMIEDCGLKGEPDLTTLPSQIVTLSMCMNHLYGTIYLTKLPHTLKMLSFLGNFITSVVVDNSSLSSTFQSADVGTTRKGDRITTVEVWGDPIDRRVQTIDFR